MGDGTEHDDGGRPWWWRARGALANEMWEAFGPDASLPWWVEQYRDVKRNAPAGRSTRSRRSRHSTAR